MKQSDILQGQRKTENCALINTLFTTYKRYGHQYLIANSQQNATNLRIKKSDLIQLYFSFSDTHRWYGRTVELEIDWRDEINIQVN